MVVDYLCNQCLLPLTFRVRIQLRPGLLDTTLCDKVCQWLATNLWFSPGTIVSSTNKTHRHDMTEILLKMALITTLLIPQFNNEKMLLSTCIQFPFLTISSYSFTFYWKQSKQIRFIPIIVGNDNIIMFSNAFPISIQHNNNLIIIKTLICYLVRPSRKSK